MRPKTLGGSYVTTPLAQAMMALLGTGVACKSVALSTTEWRNVQRVYGYSSEKDPNPLIQAGNDRNTLRHAECDGLRLLAWIAAYMPPNEDPMKVLIQLASDAGWDVDSVDVEWSEENA